MFKNLKTKAFLAVFMMFGVSTVFCAARWEGAQGPQFAESISRPSAWASVPAPSAASHVPMFETPVPTHVYYESEGFFQEWLAQTNELNPVSNLILFIYAHVFNCLTVAACDELVIPFARNWESDQCLKLSNLKSNFKASLKGLGKFAKAFGKRLICVDKNGNRTIKRSLLAALSTFVVLRILGGLGLLKIQLSNAFPVGVKFGFPMYKPTSRAGDLFGIFKQHYSYDTLAQKIKRALDLHIPFA